MDNLPVYFVISYCVSSRILGPWQKVLGCWVSLVQPMKGHKQNIAVPRLYGVVLHINFASAWTPPSLTWDVCPYDHCWKTLWSLLEDLGEPYDHCWKTWEDLMIIAGRPGRTLWSLLEDLGEPYDHCWKTWEAQTLWSFLEDLGRPNDHSRRTWENLMITPGGPGRTLWS